MPWLERMNFCSAYSSWPPSLLVDDDLLGVDVGDRRRRCSASTTSPVSIAARRSMPVPTSGASVTSSGTAWRCMFEPISARLASSCSRNGIIAVATDQICSGETSIRSTSFGATVTYWPACVRQRISSPIELALVVDRRVGLGDDPLLLLGGVEVDDLVGDHAVLDDPVRGRDEAVLGDLRVGGQRADQADVRTLGGLDRAHAAVVGRVHVAHLDRRALARQAAGAERRQAAAVRQARRASWSGP